MIQFKYLFILCILYFSWNFVVESSSIWGKLCKTDCWTDCLEITPENCIDIPGELNQTKFKAIKLVHGKLSNFHWTIAAFNASKICDRSTFIAAYPLIIAGQCECVSISLTGFYYSYFCVEGPSQPYDISYDELSLDTTPQIPYILISIPLGLMGIAIIVVVVVIVRAIRRQRKRVEERGFDVLELYDHGDSRGDNEDGGTQIIHTEEDGENGDTK